MNTSSSIAGADHALERTGSWLDAARLERWSAPSRDLLRIGLGIGVACLAILLWLPRLKGPIDLRYDAGVYYVLGTSLANGEGYRIISEPGSPEGVQYPPGLPALVALHQLVLGTSDPAVVGQFLRLTYALMFVALSLALYALARRWLGEWAGAAATVLCLLQVNTYLLSDMLFTELPFALVTVLLAMWLHNQQEREGSAQSELVGWLLATLTFALRSAGIAVLFAWVGEAAIRRRFRLALLRAALAAVPFLAWQAHVARVQSSEDYRSPAYEYQRASYQFYNVSYADNMKLIDPFAPELGAVSSAVLASRVLSNLWQSPLNFGEAVSENRGFWIAAGDAMLAPVLGSRWPTLLVTLPFVLAAFLATWGLWELVRARLWFAVLFVGASILLVCTTPWPGQFLRYLAPLVPFLAIAAVLAAARFGREISTVRSISIRRVLLGVGVATVVCSFAVQAYALMNSFRVRHYSPSLVEGETRRWNSPRWFYHERPWHHWGAAVSWLATHARADAVVATTAPHLLNLRTGHLAVMPPMEADPSRANALMQRVPIDYLIVDEMDFLDIARRYALPAIESDPASWALVHRVGGTRVFQRIAGEGKQP